MLYINADLSPETVILFSDYNLNGLSHECNPGPYALLKHKDVIEKGFPLGVSSLPCITWTGNNAFRQQW